MERLFTLDEARALLPAVSGHLARMREQKAAFDRHAQAYQLLQQHDEGEAGRYATALSEHRAALEALAGQMQALADEVESWGVELKGLDEGLVDFRSEREGRIVYLCWRVGEPDIAWWHDLMSGFRGRQPL